MLKPLTYEPRYPPEWSTGAMQAVQDDYDEIPRWLEPEEDE